MSRVVVLVLLAGCWLTAGSAMAGPVLAGPVLAGSAVGPATWVWPVDAPRAVSRLFAAPASRYGSGHRGADLQSTPGATVRAAGSGRVSYAGLLAGRGVVVVVHGALRTTYEPVTSSVPVGAEVTSGQPLGSVEAGHVGCPAPACLHWGLRRGEDYLDPVRLVLAGPVRLLPPGPHAAALALPGAAGPRPDVGPGPDAQASPTGDGSSATASGPPQPRPARERRGRDAPAAVTAAAVAAAALIAGTALLVHPRHVVVAGGGRSAGRPRRGRP